jgi:hypothetical protein
MIDAEDQSMNERQLDPGMWQLQEVAEAAKEIPYEAQPERLRVALSRLAENPSEVFDAARPEDPPVLH